MVFYYLLKYVFLFNVAVVSGSICALGTSNDFNDWIADDYGRLSFPTFNSKITDLEALKTSQFTVSYNTSNSCHFDEEKRLSLCQGRIDPSYLKELKSQTITTFLVTDYNPPQRNKAPKNLLQLENGIVVSIGDYKLAGQIYSWDIGLGMKLSTRFQWSNDSTGFTVAGDAFSNELRIGWKIEGKLNLAFNYSVTTTFFKLHACATDETWCLDLYVQLLEKVNTTWTWNVTGCVQGDASFGKLDFSATIVTTEDEGWEASGQGIIESNIINWSIEGSVNPVEANEITIFKEFFAGMSIQHIQFYDSEILGDFDVNAFKGLEGIETLAFYNSKIEDLPVLADLLSNAPTLKALYFEDSSVLNLNFGTTSALENLQLLSLKGSGPIELQNDSFYWLRRSQLKYLNFQNSNFKTNINSGYILEPVTKTLRYLDLSYTSLDVANSLQNLLQGLEITHLSLAGLGLVKIPKEALNEINQTITYLTLRGNSLGKDADNNIFQATLDFPLMPNLLELDLTNCGINFIEHGTFDQLINLRKLYLSQNFVENVQDGWITSFPASMVHLDMSRNGRDIGTLANALNPRNLNNLTIFDNLEILDLSNGAFENPENIISSINSKIVGLSICNSNVKNLTFPKFIWIEVLDISENPEIPFSNKTILNSLSSLSSLKYLHMRSNKITNSFFSAVNSFVSENGMQEFLKLKYLNLRNNNIKTLTEWTFKNFPNLESLDLSQNSITVWSTPFTINLLWLKNLKMSDNKIETLTDAALNDIKYMDRVELGNNPFSCNCDLAKFKTLMAKQKDGYLCDSDYVPQEKTIKFVRLKRLAHSENYRKLIYIQKLFHSLLSTTDKVNHCVYVEDWDSQENYYCYEQNSDNIIPLQNYNMSHVQCQLVDNVEKGLVAVYIILSVLVSMALFLGLIYWKWWDIKLLTSAVRQAAGLVFANKGDTEELVPHQFFAFVSYSDKDRRWVLNDLLPKLECWNDLRICLHERDFQVGLSILENISSCIGKSQNVILVLSQAFLRSQWCIFEMEFAQHRLLETRRDNLIVILLENIPPHKRPKTLKHILQSKTYIQWPDKNADAVSLEKFWNRLFQALSLEINSK